MSYRFDSVLDHLQDVLSESPVSMVILWTFRHLSHLIILPWNEDMIISKLENLDNHEFDSIADSMLISSFMQGISSMEEL